MATSPFFLQQFKFLDGAPAAGGKLYVKIQGTATPAVVYLDAALTIQAPQPIVLSADGTVPQFWTGESLGLRYVLYDPRGGVDTLVWDRDYIVSGGSGSGAGSYLPLAGGVMGSAANIQWPSGGSGTIAFNDDGGSWTILQRTQLFFAPSNARSGAFLQTHEYGGSQFGLTSKAGLGTHDVLIYGKNGGGGYATFNRPGGDLAVALGSGYGDNGEIRVENASGAETFNHSSEFDSTHLSGVLVAGSMRSNVGVGFFGTAAPTVRPTVNVACTDLATCIALTNQLRTHLIACGLVQ